MECLVVAAITLLVLPVVLAIVALSKSGSGQAALAQVRDLDQQLWNLKEQVRLLQAQLAELREVGVAMPPADPSPVESPLSKAATWMEPEPLPEPLPEAPPVVEPEPAPEPPPVVLTLPEPEPFPAPIPPAAACTASASTAAPVPSSPEPPPLPPPTAPEPPVQVTQAPTPRPAVARIPLPSLEPDLPAAAEPSTPFRLEDFLGSRFFLRAGVAVLVLGVLLGMGLVFQRLGPVGKMLMAYGAALGLLVGGRAGESRPAYRILGRALVAGAWALIYVVTFAVGFLDAARVIQSPLLAVVTLFLAAATCVGYTLRYRHEWTTLGAFLLIHLSLGVAAWMLSPRFTLASSFVIALTTALLAVRLGWLRLLGLGTVATWAGLALALLRAPGAASPWPLLLLAVLFLAATVHLARQEAEAPAGWFVLAILGTFLGSLGVGLHLCPEAHRWSWALAVGAAHVGAGVLLRQQDRRTLYFYTATLGLLALALVTPFRLGLAHAYSPLLRMLGLEGVLFAGVLLRERYWRGVACLGFALTLVDVLLRVAGPLPPASGWMLGAVSAAFLATAALARGPWREVLEEEGRLGAPAFTAAGTLVFVLLVLLRLPGPWNLAVLGAAVLVWVLIGARRDLPDLALEGLGIAAVFALAVLHRVGLQARPQELAATLTGLSGLVLAYGTQVRVSRLSQELDQALAGLLSGLWVLVLVVLAFVHLGPAWGPLAVGALGTGLTWVGLRTQRTELATESVLLLPVSTLASLHAWATHRIPVELVPWVGAVFGGLAVLALVQEALFRHRADAPGRALTFSLGSALLLALSAFAGLPAPWVAPALAALALGWTLWSRRRPVAEHAWEAFGFLVLAFVALPVHTWPLRDRLLGMPVRLLSLGGTLALLYGVQDLWRRLADDVLDFDSEALQPGRIRAAAALLLGVCSAGVALVMKLEALTGGMNHLVALGWGLLALFHLERGRSLRHWGWLQLGHLLLLAAVIHFLGVDLLQESDVGGLSLRLLTGLPLVAMLAYAYLNQPELDARAVTPAALARCRAWYLYAALLLLALVVRYELPRAWVAPAWGLMAVAALDRWLRIPNVHGTRIASLLAMATTLQGLGFNLVERDVVGSLPQNLLALPITVVLLFAGYVRLRRRRDPEEDQGLAGFAAGRNRFLWFGPSVALGFGVIWVEVAGTALTVVLSLYGLLLTGLGFAFRERAGRLAGLGLLSFCLLKLFFYDLRGLTGLPKVLSFLVLGLVLVSVSWTYTRFKDRMEELL